LYDESIVPVPTLTTQTAPTTTPPAVESLEFAPLMRDTPEQTLKEANAFVAIHIVTQQAILAHNQIAASLLQEKESEDIQLYILPASTLHISIFNTHVAPERLRLAQEAMTDGLGRFKLHLSGLRSFGSACLYGAPASSLDSAALWQVHKSVKKAFESRGFKSMRYWFIPHMSLVSIIDWNMLHLGGHLFGKYKKDYKGLDFGEEWVQGNVCSLMVCLIAAKIMWNFQIFSSTTTSDGMGASDRWPLGIYYPLHPPQRAMV